jgi:methionyl-tRNA formyltransferase
LILRSFVKKIDSFFCTQKRISMEKLIIFTDFSTLLVPSLLIEATLKALSDMDDIEISGICIRNNQKYYRLLFRSSKALIKTKIKYCFDKNQSRKVARLLPINIEKLARRFRFKIITLKDQNINHFELIKKLKNEIKPTLALSFYCLQKFSPTLLECFDYAVNYHNGLLPRYRGLMATCWSVYHQEEATSYSFHLMNEKIDQGNILIDGLVPIRQGARIDELEYEKVIKAVEDIPHLLKLIIRREPGRPQSPEGNYYSKKDFQRIRSIHDPTKHSSDELLKRLHAFGPLILNINGTWYDVTKLEKTSKYAKKPGKLQFKTCDGVLMKPTRFCHVTFLIYQILKWSGWPLPSKKLIPNTNGVPITSAMLNRHFGDCGKYIHEYQIIQENYDLISVFIVPTKYFSGEIRTKIKEGLQQDLAGATVNIHLVDHIKREESGKFQNFKTFIRS